MHARRECQTRDSRSLVDARRVKSRRCCARRDGAREAAAEGATRPKQLHWQAGWSVVARMNEHWRAAARKKQLQSDWSVQQKTPQSQRQEERGTWRQLAARQHWAQTQQLRRGRAFRARMVRERARRAVGLRCEETTAAALAACLKRLQQAERHCRCLHWRAAAPPAFLLVRTDSMCADCRCAADAATVAHAASHHPGFAHATRLRGRCARCSHPHRAHSRRDECAERG